MPFVDEFDIENVKRRMEEMRGQSVLRSKGAMSRLEVKIEGGGGGEGGDGELGQ